MSRSIHVDFPGSSFSVAANRHSNGGGWVATTAQVHETAFVHKDALVWSFAKVHEYANICKGAHVHGKTIVKKNATVIPGANIYGNVVIEPVLFDFGNGSVYAYRCEGTWFSQKETLCQFDKKDPDPYAVGVYDFGYGPVPAHKHQNGSGWVADSAKVDSRAYVGPNAVVFNDAVVFGHSRIEDRAVVHGKIVLINGTVSGNEVHCSQHTVKKFDFGNGPEPAQKHPNGGGWVADTATVHSTAYVDPTARVYGKAVVYQYARIDGAFHVFDDAMLSAGSIVTGKGADITDRILGKHYNFGNGLVFAHKHKNGGGWVAESASVLDTTYVGPRACVFGNASIASDCCINDGARVTGNAVLREGVTLKGNVTITGNIVVPQGVTVHSDVEYSFQNDLQFYDFGHGRVQAHKHKNGGGWVADSATVHSTAYVNVNSKVFDNAQVLGRSKLIDVSVYEDALIDDVNIIGKCFCGKIKVQNHDFGFGQVAAHRCLNGGGWVATTVTLGKTAYIGDSASAFDNAIIEGKLVDCSQVSGDIKIGPDVVVQGYTKVFGHASISGYVTIDGNVISGTNVLISGRIGLDA